MKYRVLFVFLFMGLGRSVWSQETPIQDDLAGYYPKKFITHVDILLGPSIVYPSGDEFLKDKRVIKIGYSGGLAIRHNLTPTFELSINILYENKGLKAEYEYLNTDFTPPIVEQSVQNINLNYLTASFLPRYNTDAGIFICLGPYVGYLLSEHITITTYQNGVITNKSGSRPDPYLNYKKFDFGLCGTIGYNIPINKKNIGNIQFNINHGLISINKPAIDNINNNTYSAIFAFNLHKTEF